MPVYAYEYALHFPANSNVIPFLAAADHVPQESLT